MTVECNYAIAIATVIDWLKNVAQVFSTNEKQNQDQSHLVSVNFSALFARVVIVLVGTITLELIFRQSFEDRSISFHQVIFFSQPFDSDQKRTFGDCENCYAKKSSFIWNHVYSFSFLRNKDSDDEEGEDEDAEDY